jgi:hypothetical protein
MTSSSNSKATKTSSSTIKNYFKGTKNDPSYDKFVWPNGTTSVTVSQEYLNNKGSPHLGWAFCQNGGGVQPGSGFRRRYFYCLGVFKCPDCKFVARPQMPKRGKCRKFAPPTPPNHQCLKCDKELQHVACKCEVVHIFSNGGVIMHHKGEHRHDHPPVAKPAPAALEKLAEIVDSNPDLGPARMKIGTKSRPPISQIDDSFFNQDRVGYYARKLKSGSRPEGIHGGWGAFFDFYKDLPEDFIIDMELLSENKRIITMQSPYMKEVQLEAFSGL